MTFRDEVQKSAEVRFAMDVFHALNSNNFVRFFRLLRYIYYLLNTNVIVVNSVDDFECVYVQCLSSSL